VICNERDGSMYYMKQSYQLASRAGEGLVDKGQASLLVHHTLTPQSMVNNFDNDIIINTYDIIFTYDMIQLAVRVLQARSTSL
jgi:hypothetical protein